ncbi:hypothetical protein CY34DRAFT_18720 [Suillus luteus UH-Slu-Lm8-n1]|uniref:WD40 repeat-like protein n=1 Tax=Suillus luteus UH-Slu-Lm8-n1 TaxID=930992 RepID=A0A0C9Z619_9AGAM|nr:hypothetical protein CY34DRAFT_18720 [Suillus luteus UH-Slu-Lm8-n1]
MSAVTPRKTMRGHTSYVSGVAHLPCGKRIITCSFDGSLRLWDLESGAQVGGEWRDEGDEAGVWVMALSPNGKTLVGGSIDGTVRLWDVEMRKVVLKWEGHSGFVMSVCWSPNGERVVSGSYDGTARVWDVKNGKPVQGLNPIKTEHEYVLAVSYSPEAKMIATGGYNKSGIKIWGAKTGKRLTKIELDWSVWSLAWTSDEKKLIAGSIGSIRIFGTATWQQIVVLEGHTEPVGSLTLFQNDCLLASTSWDKTARLWNLNTNLQVGPLLQHEQRVDCAAFSADGKLLSTACHDGNAYVWDIQAVLKTTGLEGLLSIPDAQNSQAELKKNLKPLSGANAPRPPPILPTSHRVPQGFFDGVQNCDPPFPRRRRRSFAPSWGSRPHALLARIPQLFRRSQPNVDEPTELQQSPGPSTFPRHRHPVVEVPALDDKKALYVAWRPKPTTHNAERIKNSKWWARVVLFICCVSPSTESDH